MTDIHPHPVPPHILCSSITGNTRSLADALAGATGGPVFPAGHPPLLDHAGTLLLGFWVRRGLPDGRSLRLWQDIRGRRVFFFGTHGTRVPARSIPATVWRRPAACSRTTATRSWAAFCARGGSIRSWWPWRASRGTIP